VSSLRVDAEHLDREGVAVKPSHGRPSRTLVSCGPPLTSLAIVDPGSLQEREAGLAGEILVSGGSVSPGYYNSEPGGEDIFGVTVVGRPSERFVRTGDLGLLMNGELFVTGRLKDLVIIRGRNIHPEDIETTIRGLDGWFQRFGCAAFSVEAEDGERLIVVQELDPGVIDKEEILTTTTMRIQEAMALTHGIAVDEVHYVAPGQIPRTTSGKVRRSECRSRFLQRQLLVL